VESLLEQPAALDGAPRLVDLMDAHVIAPLTLAEISVYWSKGSFAAVKVAAEIVWLYRGYDGTKSAREYVVFFWLFGVGIWLFACIF